MAKNNQFLLFLILSFTLLTSTSMAQDKPEWKPEHTEKWSPEPKMVDPGNADQAPSDAFILFDGKDFSAWESVKGGDVKWELENGIVTVKPGTGDIQTKEEFGDIQLHLEWRSPEVVKGDGQNRGNSGVYLQNRYEVQILDSYNNRTYSNGQAGAVYKQHIPLVNTSRGPGEWQTYDIIYTAPVFEGDKVKYPARITVLHNGVVIQNNVAIQGNTEYIGLPEYSPHGPAPIKLQDHNELVSFRNIWVRKL